MIRDLLELPDSSNVAIRTEAQSVSYADLKKRVDELANELSRFGLGKGDRIAMALPNGLEVIALFLAASWVGTAAPLNPAYTRDEFKFYLEDTNARALIVPPNGADEARAAANEDVILIEAAIDGAGQVRLSSKSGAVTGTDCNDQDNIALILHTSGTTSRPKRVPLSHANLLTSAGNVAATYQLTPADVSLCVMPLFHVHGLVASTLATFFTGGTVVVPPRFNPLSFWSTVREHRATWYSAVPTIHQVLLARAKAGKRPEAAKHLRFVRSCSSALAPQTMADLEDRFGVAVLEAYGMTEAAHQMASNPLPPLTRKPGSVGCGTAVEIGILND